MAVAVAETFVDPAHALLTIMAAADLSESPRGQKDLAKFARRLSESLKNCGYRSS